MYTIGAILSFIIAIFFVVKYYHEHSNEPRFSVPDFLGVGLVITLVSAFLSWAAIATLLVVKAADYYYKYYFKKD